MAHDASTTAADERWMQRAVELAARGEGRVEPNPMVGCVIVRDGEAVGEGWHERYGQAHAEVNALAKAGDNARGATAYVTLEPCRHTGKTPPCTRALIAAGISRVVVAVEDPFPQVAGGGLAELRAAGVEVVVGPGTDTSRELLAPYLKLTTTGRPWVIAKWAMTLDGKIATRTGSSQWISGEASRAIVHQIRGRVDTVMIGRRTAIVDDPHLTARLPDAEQAPRVATRIVLGSPPHDCKLIQTVHEAPVLIVAGDQAEADSLRWAADAGAEVITITAEGNPARLTAVLDELGRRRMTNVLIEGGGDVLGAALDAGQIDEAHVFIAPKLVGGQPAPSPIGGGGVDKMENAALLTGLKMEQVGEDAYLHGRLGR